MNDVQVASTPPALHGAPELLELGHAAPPVAGVIQAMVFVPHDGHLLACVDRGGGGVEDEEFDLVRLPTSPSHPCAPRDAPLAAVTILEHFRGSATSCTLVASPDGYAFMLYRGSDPCSEPTRERWRLARFRATDGAGWECVQMRSVYFSQGAMISMDGACRRLMLNATRIQLAPFELRQVAIIVAGDTLATVAEVPLPVWRGGGIHRMPSSLVFVRGAREGTVLATVDCIDGWMSLATTDMPLCGGTGGGGGSGGTSAATVAAAVAAGGAAGRSDALIRLPVPGHQTTESCLLQCGAHSPYYLTQQTEAGSGGIFVRRLFAANTLSPICVPPIVAQWSPPAVTNAPPATNHAGNTVAPAHAPRPGPAGKHLTFCAWDWREPGIALVAYSVGGPTERTTHVAAVCVLPLPWSPKLHPQTPHEFRAVVRALAWLRLTQGARDDPDRSPLARTRDDAHAAMLAPTPSAGMTSSNGSSPRASPRVSPYTSPKTLRRAGGSAHGSHASSTGGLTGGIGGVASAVGWWAAVPIEVFECVVAATWDAFQRGRTVAPGY